MEEKQKPNIFDQIHNFWIKPEILKRKKQNKLPKDFKIYSCLIKLPKVSNTIVQFNDEISFTILVENKFSNFSKEGQKIYLHDIDKIHSVKPPEVDGERVAFIYLYKVEKGYNIIFDFSPQNDNYNPEEEFHHSKKIIESLNAQFKEKSILLYGKFEDNLKKIGLWASPSLTPFPLSGIIKHVGDGNCNKARQLLVEYCNKHFIEKISNKWWDSIFFNSRKELIEEAIFAHINKKFALSIHTLFPQLEGIITDFIFAKVSEDNVPWKQDSKTRKFKDIIFQDVQSSFFFTKVLESTVNFILNGPVLKTFKNWKNEIDKIFPNRHALGHGKYDMALYSEENSIKLFLLLDSIFIIFMRNQEYNSY